ncbi:alpha/beta hydrolase fold domain-containing protein [Burkholderia gladioli]|uniref:alpha/beta hydrolase fold domain-containing protein n=1 Tax=Burkholderia gladioli TaxID=28095 RepID=UPI00163FEFDA|nr:alpha/beta hydrolase fold domain-containing protein [Burkholderia gladioli]
MGRDRGVQIAGQILIYPMLDDRTAEAIAEVDPFLSITSNEVQLIWRARIPVGASQLPLYSPARLTDFRGMPRTYLDVGELDLFCLEGLSWITQLAAAGVPVEFHLYSGVNHGFELLAPESEIARQAMAWRCDAIRRLTS